MKKFLLTEKSHTFETEKHKKKRKLLTWIISISALVIVLGSISLLVLLKNYDYNISNMVEGESTTEAENETSTDAPPVATGNADILLSLHDDDDNLKFLCIVKADAASKNISVCSVDINSTVDSQTLAQKYKASEEKQRMDSFKTDVSKLSGINIDRYISADYGEFTQAISTLGGVTMNIPKDVTYNKNDIVLSLKKGEWKLIGTNLLNYLLVSSQSTQNEIISAILQEYITPKNYENSENIYKRLVNILDTDITAFDFNSALPALEAFAYADGNFNITTFTLKG